MHNLLREKQRAEGQMRDEQTSSLYNSNADSLSSPKELTKVQQQNRMLLKPSASRRRGKAGRRDSLLRKRKASYN